MTLDLGADFVPGATATADSVNDKFNAIEAYLNTPLDGSGLDTADGRLRQSTGIATGTGGTLALTTSYQDVPSATVTFTPDVACYALVTTVFDLSTIDSGGNVTLEVLGALVVDGTAQTLVARLLNQENLAGGTVYTRSTVSQVYRVALTAAAHTLKLQTKKQAAGTGVANCFPTNCRFVYQLVAQ